MLYSIFRKSFQWKYFLGLYILVLQIHYQWRWRWWQCQRRTFLLWAFTCEPFLMWLKVVLMKWDEAYEWMKCSIPCLFLADWVCQCQLFAVLHGWVRLSSADAVQRKKECSENYIGIFVFPWIFIGQNTTLKQSGLSGNFFKGMHEPEHPQDTKLLSPQGSFREDILQLYTVLFFFSNV